MVVEARKLNYFNSGISARIADQSAGTDKTDIPKGSRAGSGLRYLAGIDPCAKAIRAPPPGGRAAGVRGHATCGRRASIRECGVGLYLD